MKKLILLCLFISLLCDCYSQTSFIVPSATTVANASVADTKSYSAFTNPASISNFRNPEIGFQYSNKYGLKALSQKSIFLTFPTGQLDIAFCTTYYGFSLYNELLAGVALSKNFNETFKLGVQYNYLSVFFSESNKRYSSFFPQIGLQVKPSKVLTIGFQVFNPMQQTIKGEFIEKHIPSIFSLGIDWSLSESLRLLLQADKNLTGLYRLAGGFEYNIKELLTVKAGAFNAEYLVPVLGFDFKLKVFEFNLNTDFHPVLGLQNTATIRFNIHKK